MRAENRLGIVVNSNRYFDFVEKLTDAALEQGKQVRIHLLGSGCEFMHTDACLRLSRLVQMTLCPAIPQRDGGAPGKVCQRGVDVVPPRELSAILQNCHRYVVF